MRRIARTAAAAIAAVLVLGALYLLLWPVPIDPAPWAPPEAPAPRPNERLAPVERVGEGAVPGPEDVAIDGMGRIHAGGGDGAIVRLSADGSRREVLARTDGRPLGLDFDATGRLVAAVAGRGLLRIDRGGAVEVLAERAGGTPIGFADDVDVGPDGRIWFSDASTRFGMGAFRLDLLEHRPNGRLLVYDPADGSVRVALDSLWFANGVAVGPGGEFVLVAETGKYRIRRLWLAGPKVGTADVFVDNMPGFPDGVSWNGEGIFWVALPSRRQPLVDRLLPRPWLRKVVARLPARLQPEAERYGYVLGLDVEGRILHDLQDPSGAYAPITSVEESGGFLWLGSVEEPAVGRIPVPTRGRD